MKIKKVISNVESEWIEVDELPANSKRNVAGSDGIVCYMDSESLPPLPISVEEEIPESE